MSLSIPTVKIKSPISDDNYSGYIVINECDKQDSDELFLEVEESVEVTDAKISAKAAKASAKAALQTVTDFGSKIG